MLRMISGQKISKIFVRMKINNYPEEKWLNPWYFDRGHCKYNDCCRFRHPSDICMVYLQNKNCILKTCTNRHPKVFKYWSKNWGRCQRKNTCNYLHVTLGQSKLLGKEHFTCYACHNTWDEKGCVVEHKIGNHALMLCWTATVGLKTNLRY